MEYKLNKSDCMGVMRIVGIYVIFGSLWIYFSDSLLWFLIQDEAIKSRISQIKGVIFIILTAMLLYRLIIRHVQVTKAAEEAQKVAKEAAEAANRAKNQFLSNMSHELRTPLAGVLGMLDITLGGPLEAEQREFIQTARNSAGSLVRILNDILEITRIEAGMLAMEEKPFPLKECVSGLVDIFTAEAQRKGLELVLSIADEVPETVIGDQLRLRQVLTNLLGNAVKFTEKGKVGLSVEVLSNPSGRQEVTFSVSDTGIGIPDDKRPLIFRPFSQVDESHTRRYGGTGLGLVISKDIVQRMGGEIHFDCEAGGGCRFTVTVPFKEIDPRHTQKDEMPAQGS